MSKVIKFIDFYERQLNRKEYEKHQWYYDQLDAILDELFEIAADEYGIEAWSELAKRSGLAYSTIVNLGERWTKRPQYRTVLLIARAVHRDITLKAKPKSKKATPSLRLVSA